MTRSSAVKAQCLSARPPRIVWLSLVALMLLVTAGASPAAAWSCNGHQAIAIIAERLLGAGTVSEINRVLAASPVDRTLSRFCGPDADLMADAATWADDQRAVEPATAGWHFVNLARSLGAAADYRAVCARGNCVIEAVVANYATLTTSRDPRRRANALRFLIHLVGDLHQPLHSITNGDRGGNCLAVAWPDEPVRQQKNFNVVPNLHRVWDSDIVGRLMKARRLADPRALATHVAGSGPATPVQARAPTVTSVLFWAKAANEVARNVAYGRMPVSVPMESATAITLKSCDANNHVASRMANRRERITPAYEQAAQAAIVGQMRVAGERLASVLMAAFPAR